MDHANCDHHVARNPEGSDTPEKPEDQTNATEKLGRDGQKSKERGNMHLLREETHRTAESISTKPAEHLLCAMCEENESTHKAENRQGQIVGSSHELVKHGFLLL